MNVSFVVVVVVDVVLVLVAVVVVLIDLSCLGIRLPNGRAKEGKERQGRQGKGHADAKAGKSMGRQGDVRVKVAKVDVVLIGFSFVLHTAP